MKNSEKMKRPQLWPDPPEIKFPELEIQCPACNDINHRMTIFFNKLSSQKGEYYIRCDKCLALFTLKQCSIIQTISTSSTTPSTS
jgi:uncharacterized C2H2 Zn-finger protein